MGEFEQIPEIKERIERSKMELQEFGFYWAPEWDSQSCADQDFVNNFKKGWLSQQSKIEQLERKLNAVTNLLNDLKAGIKDFRGLDLYDKGYRVTTEYIIQDLEKALRGES